ncbi:hypothetical protein EDEG_00896 [Edhazardia aedis USNM 41457]|uniref:Uncharacterized protein n=1 Tax=Edhazardia aedis (strain USNM 41457) TaxID=1003232 RepID=J8ZZ99_EDHAE|nr:hypothetical protein EDEG_00896 [Edhazardia aedis USNM 41457]|eukprot:EJW05003.1 hypothetical protein EDEG_00896 [Edhazardia aedis USNM 41457]
MICILAASFCNVLASSSQFNNRSQSINDVEDDQMLVDLFDSLKIHENPVYEINDFHKHSVEEIPTSYDSSSAASKSFESENSKKCFSNLRNPDEEILSEKYQFEIEKLKIIRAKIKARRKDRKDKSINQVDYNESLRKKLKKTAPKALKKLEF